MSTFFALRTVPSGQWPAAAVLGSAPPGSPQRVAPLRLQQESLQREKEEAQQKERERQAEEREKEEQREEVSFWEDMQQDSDFVLLFFFYIYIFCILFHSLVLRFRGCRVAVSSRRGS